MHPDDGTDGQDRQAQGDDHCDVGHHQPEQQGGPPDRGQAQPIEVPALDVTHQRRGSRHSGHRKRDRHGQEKGLVVEGGAGQLLERAQVDGVEERRDEDGRNDCCGLPRYLPKGPAGDGPYVVNESDLSPRDAGTLDRGHERTSSLSIRDPVISMKTSSKVGVRIVRLLMWSPVRPRATATVPRAAGPSAVLTVMVPPALEAESSPSMERRASTAPVPSPSTSATITSCPTECLRSAGEPCATSRPAEMMPTRSARVSASSRYCVVKKMVMPSSRFSLRTSDQTAERLWGSRPVVGSSRNSTSGLWTRAAARSRRRFMPPE